MLDQACTEYLDADDDDDGALGLAMTPRPTIAYYAHLLKDLRAGGGKVIGWGYAFCGDCRSSAPHPCAFNLTTAGQAAAAAIAIKRRGVEGSPRA